MSSFDQSSFAGGQVSQKNWGTYSTESETRLALARNVLIDSEGSIQKRPGSQVVLYGNVNDSEGNSLLGKPWTRPAGSKTRLIQFRYSNNEQYVLVMKDEKMDIVQNGTVVAIDIDTPWPEEDLIFDPDDDDVQGLKFSQQGRRIVFTHPNHLPRQFNRISATEWRIEFVNEARRGTTASGLSVVKAGGSEDFQNLEFRFIAVGLGEGEKWLSEVTAAKVPIQSIEFDTGIATINIAGTIKAAVGDRILLEDLTGADELNGNQYRIVSTETVDSGTNQEECRFSQWREAATAAAARELARNEIRAAGFTQNITYEENVRNPTVPRTSTRTQTVSFLIFSSTQSGFPPSVTPSQIISALRSISRTSPAQIRSGETVTSPSSNFSISSISAIQFDSSDRRTAPRATAFINSRPGSSYYYKSFSVNIEYTTTTSLVDTTRISAYLARARGCKLRASVTDTIRSFSIDTGLPSITAHTANTGNLVTFIVSVEGQADARYTLSWSGVSPDVERIAIYQDNGRGFGLAGSTLGPTTSKIIQNVLEDTDQGPPTFRNPFRDANPQCSTAFQARRAYGGFGTLRPNTIEFSRPTYIEQFDQTFPIDEGDAFDVFLDTEEINDVRHMVRLRDNLFVLTGGGMWRIFGNGGFNAKNNQGSREQSYGASHLRPLVIGDTMLHVAETGDIIYATALNAATDRHVTGLLSRGFSDILQRKHIIDWDYAEGRTIIILAAMDDGTMLCATYDPVTGHVGTSTWDFGGGYKCIGVNIKNSDGIDPIAIFLVEDSDGVQHLWKMEFSPESISSRFLADGVTEHSAEDSVDRLDGGWIQYNYQDQDIENALIQKFPFPNQQRLPYLHGHEYESLIRTIPSWANQKHNFKKAQARLIIGSDVFIRGIPGGDKAYFKESITGRQEKLSGMHEAWVASGTRRNVFGPQVEIGQTTPAPFTLLGITCYASGEER